MKHLFGREPRYIVVFSHYPKAIFVSGGECKFKRKLNKTRLRGTRSAGHPDDTHKNIQPLTFGYGIITISILISLLFPHTFETLIKVNYGLIILTLKIAICLFFPWIYKFCPYQRQIYQSKSIKYCYYGIYYGLKMSFMYICKIYYFYNSCLLDVYLIFQTCFIFII